jgi:hypothetical protein
MPFVPVPKMNPFFTLPTNCIATDTTDTTDYYGFFKLVTKHLNRKQDHISSML